MQNVVDNFLGSLSARILETNMKGRRLLGCQPFQKYVCSSSVLGVSPDILENDKGGGPLRNESEGRNHLEQIGQVYSQRILLRGGRFELRVRIERTHNQNEFLGKNGGTTTKN